VIQDNYSAPITLNQHNGSDKEPAQNDTLAEVIDGVFIEKVRPIDNWRMVASLFGRLFMVRQQYGVGRLTGPKDGYPIWDDYYIPDVAYLKDSEKPELVVEVVPADDMQRNLLLPVKIGNYLSLKTAVWVVRPQMNVVQVFQHGKRVRTLHENQYLTADDILPTFRVKLEDIFNR